MTLQGTPCDAGFLEIPGARPNSGRRSLPEEEKDGRDKVVLNKRQPGILGEVSTSRSPFHAYTRSSV